MKGYTKEQIEAKIRELWSGKKFYDNDAVPDELKINVDENRVEITMSSSYEPPGLSFKQLKALSDFFETDDITDPERFNMSGCPTCDYGSEYGFTLVIK